MNGELLESGDAWKLRFKRRLSHPPEKVWRAITEPEHLAAWFPHKVSGDWVVGGSLRFESDGPEVSVFDGEVLAYEAPSLLEFSWGPDTLRFEIAPASDGCTLTLTDTIDELGKAARDGAGWHTCLDTLEYHLRGESPSQSNSDRWKEVHAGYVENFGPEAATIGPPESMKEYVT